MRDGSIDRRSLFAAAVAVALFPGRAWAQDCPVLIDVDYHGWSGLDGWTEALRPRLSGWWRDINRALGATACKSGKSLRVEFFRIRPEHIAAAADGDRILINAPYVLANKDNPDMFRMIAHELVHVAQAYPKGAHPHWLTEGIADYVRYYVLFPDDPGRAFDPGQEDWRDGYSPTAGLLAWAEARWPGVVGTVNLAMRDGDDGEAALAHATGQPTGRLWRAYLAGRPDAASAVKRRAYWESLKHAS